MKLRLVAVLVALTALVLLVQDVPLALYLRSIESNRITTELQRDAFVIAGRSEAALADGTAQNNAPLTAMLMAYSRAEDTEVLVVDANEVVVAASSPVAPVGRKLENRPELQSALSGDTASGEKTATASMSGIGVLYVAVPVLSGARTLGAVRLTYPASNLDERVNERVKGLAIVAGLTLLAAIAVAFLLAATITRPIRRLQETTAQLASGDLTARAATAEGAPELRKLGRDLNTMSDRLSNLVEAQRSFAGDASHQLRTPLTALRLRLDEAADKMTTSPAAAEDSLDMARAETERLQHVIDGLLRLARAEGERQELVVVDISTVAAERFGIWQPLAEEQGVQLELAAPKSALILAVPEAAEQILDNYLDNALSVSPAGSTLMVTIVEAPGTDGGTTTLLVTDAGPGLTAEARTRAFDRFWSEREDNAGTGLGLAIVRHLAAASGASVELRESASGGIEAVATFRRANPGPRRA